MLSKRYLELVFSMTAYMHKSTVHINNIKEVYSTDLPSFRFKVGHLVEKWGKAAVISCLTQLSGKCLSTISLILACWFCRMSGAKNKMTYSMEAWVARAVLRCSGKGYAEIWCKKNHNINQLWKSTLSNESMPTCKHSQKSTLHLGSHLIIDIIRPKTTNQHIHKCIRYWDASCKKKKKHRWS